MPRLPARGFTLIEVMVVMVIIAILVTMVSLSMRGDRAGDQLEEEAKRLVALLNLLREEAVMRNRDLGWLPSAEGYRFVQRTAAGEEERRVQPAGASAQRAPLSYLPLLDDNVFRPRRLPPGTVLRFEAGPTRLTITPAGQPEGPLILATAQELLMPEGRLVLTHPATERVVAIRIRPDGATLESPSHGR